MKWSVWNQGLGAFDYFECSRTQDVLNVEKPAHIVSRTLGSTVDQAAWPLPADAQHIGTGSRAIGRVAVRKSSLALGSTAGGDLSLVKAGLLVTAGYLTWKYVVGRSR